MWNYTLFSTNRATIICEQHVCSVELLFMLSMEGQRSFNFHQKYLHLCSKDERKPYRFGTTWWGSNSWRNFHFCVKSPLILFMETMILFFKIIWWKKKQHLKEKAFVTLWMSLLIHLNKSYTDTISLSQIRRYDHCTEWRNSWSCFSSMEYYEKLHW